MAKNNRHRKLGVNPAHRRAMLMNLAENLIKHKRIKTTDSRAKALREYIEPMITKAKKGDLNSRRMVLKKLHKNAVQTLFDEIGPAYADRPGGYTRIIKLGFRNDDKAAMSLIEFVDFESEGETAVAKNENEKAE
ncbi:MAG TPA: 50S ribosomal protein L17 [Candidatus Marinimicrobia bacterium]|jgi:large subunit ribosomal protein L17|nr:50S ribosomal protein L17 [Candidatus Neomarinimicrobiota bacterium]HIA90920.1 50S ribosomal protein L17 [Candidatus Neomarinimicrobiota bacterium]